LVIAIQKKEKCNKRSERAARLLHQILSELQKLNANIGGARGARKAGMQEMAEQSLGEGNDDEESGDEELEYFE
jgi:hypothetical protein